MTTAIDHIITSYQQLFCVNFLHQSFTGGTRPFIAAVLTAYPDQETMQLFSRHHIGYRFFANTLMCFIECEPFNPPAKKPVVPKIPFDETVRIRFLLKASQSFLANTAVVPAGAQQLYQFSNRLNAGTGMFISQHTNGVNNDDLTDINTVAPDENCFAVIDIYNSGTPATYALFNADGTLADQQDYADNNNDGNPDADDKPLQYQIIFKPNT